MSPQEGLELIRGYALANRIIITRHAEVRMVERGMTVEDIHHGLCTASACSQQPEGRWRVRSLDREGIDLTLIVVLDDGVVIVTLF
jgi:hypothetical protein